MKPIFLAMFIMFQRHYVIVAIITCFIIGNIYQVQAAQDDICETKEEFELYECRVKQVCETYKPEKPTYKTEKYEKAETLKSAYI